MTVEFDVGGNKYPSSAPGTWQGDQNFLATGTIAEGATHSYSLGATVAGYFINNQTNFLGLGAFIAADHPYDLSYYGYFTGGHGTALEITVSGTKTVTGSNTSGSGSDGQVVITYATASALEFALAPQSGTDANGNAYAAGYTGPVSVFQPGSSPSVVETWHNFGTSSGAGTFTGIARYKLMPGNAVRVNVIGTFSGTGTATFPAIPSAYWPTNTLNFTVIQGNSPNRAQLNSSGVLAIIVSGASNSNFCQDIPLD
jgi:hypothetical protein